MVTVRVEVAFFSGIYINTSVHNSALGPTGREYWIKDRMAPFSEEPVPTRRRYSEVLVRNTGIITGAIWY